MTTDQSSEVFLDESRTEMHVELHEESIAGVLEAMDLARLNHQDVAGAGFELFAVDDPLSATCLRLSCRSDSVAEEVPFTG